MSRAELTLIPLVPRTTANCLDLAVRYYGRDLPQILSLWLMVAVPACATVYLLSVEADFGLRMALIVFWLATLPLGMLVVADAAGQTFACAQPEEPPARAAHPFRRVAARLSLVLVPLVAVMAFISGAWEGRLPRGVEVLVRGGVFGIVVVLVPALLSMNQGQRLRALGWSALVPGLLLRAFVGLGPALVLFGSGGWILLGLMLCLFPGVWAAAWCGFIVERATLRRLDPQLHDRSIDRVLAKEVGDLAVRGMGIVLCCGLFFGLLALSADYVVSLLSGRAVLTERVVGLEALLRYIALDPATLTLLTGVALLVYPIGRLAWFFCYVDARVRRDCWDMELALGKEAARLVEGS